MGTLLENVVFYMTFSFFTLTTATVIKFCVPVVAVMHPVIKWPVTLGIGFLMAMLFMSFIYRLNPSWVRPATEEAPLVPNDKQDNGKQN